MYLLIKNVLLIFTNMVGTKKICSYEITEIFAVYSFKWTINITTLCL